MEHWSWLDVWHLRLRVQDLTRQHVRDALWKDRTLVKTYGLRGTIHLFPTHELSLWLTALRAKTPPRPPDNGLPSADDRAKIVQAMTAAQDRKQLTRDELAEHISRNVGAWATAPAMPAFGGRWPT